MSYVYIFTTLLWLLLMTDASAILTWCIFLFALFASLSDMYVYMYVCRGYRRIVLNTPTRYRIFTPQTRYRIFTPQIRCRNIKKKELISTNIKYFINTYYKTNYVYRIIYFVIVLTYGYITCTQTSWSYSHRCQSTLC